MRACTAAFLLGALLLSVAVAPSAAADSSLIAYWRGEWPKTDFAKAAVPLEEIKAGGPPRDGIPPIDRPRFEPVEQASTWLGPDEPLVALGNGAEARGYPLAILIWHEIVNDTVAGVPVAVVFCPLCNSALAFDRRAGGRVLDFGTTGKLRHSDLVMWDRQTESWWQQMTGQAIVGTLTGTRLKALPAPVITLRTFRQEFPEGRVLSRDTGFSRPYGHNPYAGYDTAGSPFLFAGQPDRRLRPMERVVGVEIAGRFRAYPFPALAQKRVVNDRLGAEELVIFFDTTTRSVLDEADVSRGRQVGSATVFRPLARGRRLAFVARDGGFYDRETGSRWNALGRALSGAMAGEQLPPLPFDTPFAFAWLAFHPESDIWTEP
jgi:hypothetical protein